MFVHGSAVKTKGSGEIRTGTVRDVGKRCARTAGFPIIEKAIEHFVQGPVAANGDDPIMSSVQGFPGKGYCVQSPPGVGKVHPAEDALDPLLPIRPIMTRASCPGVWIDNEKRFSVCQR
jgi:hypothetical protein